MLEMSLQDVFQGGQSLPLVQDSAGNQAQNDATPLQGKAAKISPSLYFPRGTRIFKLPRNWALSMR
jgi:hypothetical protein